MAEKPEAKEETPIVEPKPEAKEPEVKPEGEKPQPVTREEYEQLRAELQTADGRWKTAQGVINKQKDEIESLKDNQELWKVLIGMNAERKGISEEESEQDLQRNKPDFMQQFNVVQQTIDAKHAQKKINSYRSIVEDELGLKEGDDDYEIIQSHVLKGKFDKADKKIAAIKAKKTEQPEVKGAKVETEEERIERLADEKLKAKMIKEGFLTPEVSEPSASGNRIPTDKDKFREWVDGLTTEEFRERKKEINEMMAKGLIK